MSLNMNDCELYTIKERSTKERIAKERQRRHTSSKTDDELLEALMREQSLQHKHTLKRKQTNEKKRKNKLRNQARDVTVNAYIYLPEQTNQ